jgi:hypothetical protein
MLLIEASLWLLADWEGIGTARARTLAEKTEDRTIKGLARILTGASATARRALSGSPVLARFANAVGNALSRTLTADQLRQATIEASENLNDPGLALAVR